MSSSDKNLEVIGPHIGDGVAPKVINILDGNLFCVMIRHLYSLTSKRLRHVLRRNLPAMIFCYNTDTEKKKLILLAILTGISSLLGYRTKVVGFSGKIRSVPFRFPWRPISTILHVPQLFGMYFNCLIKKVTGGRVVAFNDLYGPMNMLYESFGLRMMRCGSWGYDYEHDFGASQKDRYYNHVLSYGILHNALSRRSFTFLSMFLFWLGAVLFPVVEKQWFFALLIGTGIILSPYFSFSFITYVRPHNIAWGLGVPALLFTLHGKYILLSAALLLMSYLSFTTVFYIGFATFMIMLYTEVYSALWVFIPVGLKIGVDMIATLGISNYHTPLELFRESPKKKFYRKSVEAKPVDLIFKPCHILGVLQLLVVTAIAVVTGNPIWTGLLGLLLLVCTNFLFFRFSDQDVMYRIYLIALVAAALSHSGGGVLLYVSMFFLVFIQPHWVDENQFIGETDGKADWIADHICTFPNRLQELMKEMLRFVEPGSRILFQFSGHFDKSPFRWVLYVWYRVCHDLGVVLLPAHGQMCDHTEWIFEYSALLNDGQDMDKCLNMLVNGGFSYVMVYTKTLTQALELEGYEEVGRMSLGAFDEIAEGGYDRNGWLILLRVPGNVSLISPATLRLEKMRNRMKISGCSVDQEIIVKIGYHQNWVIKQGDKALDAEASNADGLSFLRTVSRSEEPIDCYFRGPHRILR